MRSRALNDRTFLAANCWMREYIALGEHCAPILIADNGPFHGREREAWVEYNEQRDSQLDAVFMEQGATELRKAGLGNHVIQNPVVQQLIAHRSRLFMHAIRLGQVDHPPPAVGAESYDDDGHWRAQRETEVDAIMGVYLSVPDATRSKIADILNRGLPRGRRPITGLKIRNAEDTCVVAVWRASQRSAGVTCDSRWDPFSMIHLARVYEAMWNEIASVQSVIPVPDRIVALARSGDLIRMYQRLHALDYGAEADARAAAEKLRALTLAHLERRLKKVAA